MLAEFGTGQVFWSMLWFFLFVVWLMLLFSVFGDIFRSRDLSGWGKAFWSIFIIFLPYLGVFVYLIARGGKMRENTMLELQAQDAAQREYIRNTVGTTGAADEIARLADLHAKGTLSDEEFAAAKAKILS